MGFRGRRDTSGKGLQPIRDTATVDASGSAVLNLSYVPIAGSEHLYLNGFYQHPEGWTRDVYTVTLADPDAIAREGDELEMLYFYDPTAIQPVVTSGTVVDWQAAGWKILTLPDSDQTDYSGTGVDDSGWSLARAAVGNPSTQDPGGTNWPAPNTVTGNTNDNVWLRRPFSLHQTSVLTINGRIDGNLRVYVDGGKVVDTGDAVADVGPFTITVAGGEHVLAVRVGDDAADPTGDYLYGDVQVTWAAQ